MTDDIHGALNSQGSCSIPQVIAVAGFYECTYTVAVNGNGGDTETSTTTASGTDDDSNAVSAMDSATVTLTDVAPTATVTKTASPTSVDEPGGNVLFTVRVDNTGTAESLSLTALVDDVHGALGGQDTCAVPQTVAASSFYQCAYTVAVNGNAGDTETSSTTATLSDDDGNSITPSSSAVVTINDVVSSITVTKTAAPTSLAEPGGNVTFTVRVDNTSAADSVTITGLIDDVHSDLNGQGTCSSPQSIAAAGFYECTYTVAVNGNGGDTETSTTTASGTDDDGAGVSGMGSATVTLTDVAPTATVTKTASPTSVDEPGGNVLFTVRVDNTGTAESLSLTALVDDVHGALGGQGTCAVPQTVAASSFYQCTYTVAVNGNAGDTEASSTTATLSDDDGNSITPSDSAVVTINDVASSITVTKTAAPASLAEPGGNVSFTVRVDNTSAADSVTITGLMDDVHDDLNGQGTCSSPQSIAAAGFYECAYTTAVSGNAGDTETSTTTASGTDDDGSAVSAMDSATVTLTDVAPVATVTKTALPTTVDEPGSNVLFTVRVDNTGTVEALTLSALVDDVHSSLAGQGTCAVPQTVAASSFYQCTYTAAVNGNAGDTESSSTTATLSDDDGNSISPSGSATVTVTGIDFGDAPEVYTTLLGSDGARHTISAGFFLGAAVDADPNGQPTATANGDDADGNNDEDGVVFTSALVPGMNATLDITASAAGLLDAWIDWAADDNFTSPSDQVFASEPLVAGINTLTIPIPPTAELGATFGRFRFSTAGGLSSTGLANDGEVEDYEIGVDMPAISLTNMVMPSTVDEPGGSVTHTVRVDNTGTAVALLSALVDDTHGDLDGQGTCSVPQTVGVSGFYQCSYTSTITGNAGDSQTSTTAATGTSLNLPVASMDASTVTINDLASSITVTKTATPMTLSEPGGNASFTVRVDNTSVADSVTISSLVDDVHGSLAGQGTCAVPQTLAVAGFYECTYGAAVNGNALDAETSTTTASGSDDDGAPVSAQGSATVSISDVAPTATVTKTALPITVDEPGGDVLFTVRVENTGSAEALALTALVDDVHGVLGGQGTCAVPQTVAASGFYQCTYTVAVNGNAGDSETSITTATVTDDDGNSISPSGGATVTLTGTDFGDAPDTYNTLLNSDGARHTISAGFFLGGSVDADGDGQPTAIADGDDMGRVDDEDGVVFVSAPIPGTMTTVEVIASLPGLLDAWIDWDLDGDFNTPGDQIFATQLLSAGVNTLSLTAPSATSGVVMARFRYSSTGGLGPNGLASDGEVEDYRLVIDETAPEVTYVTSTPSTQDDVLSPCESTRVRPSRLEVIFSEALVDDGSPAAADRLENYLLVATGPNFNFDSSACGATVGDDVAIPVQAVSYSADSPTAPQSRATLQLNQPLVNDHYRLIVCGALEDPAGNSLSGGDALLDFRVDSANLFSNGHFDCDLDSWGLNPPTGNELTHDASFDADSSFDSGALAVLPQTYMLSATQCVDVVPNSTMQVGGRFRVEGAVGDSVGVIARCETFGQAACGGAVQDTTSYVQFVSDTSQQWVLHAFNVAIASATQSAQCRFEFQGLDQATVEVHADQLFATTVPSMPFFSDGFETGDTSAWSQTNP